MINGLKISLGFLEFSNELEDPHKMTRMHTVHHYAFAVFVFFLYFGVQDLHEMFNVEKIHQISRGNIQKTIGA